MKLLKTILVAVNFDDTLDRVLEAASSVATKFGSEVILTHVVETADTSGQAPESLHNAIGARLEQIQQQLTAKGVRVSQMLCLNGNASVRIVEAAERTKTNLVLLGTRRLTPDHHFPLGTTTENVMRCSTRPVLAVPPDRPVALATIVCPVDFSDVSARALNEAIHLARAYRSQLHVLTVVTLHSHPRGLAQHGVERAASAEELAKAQCQREFDEFLTRFDFQDVGWEKHVLCGEPAHEIVEWARSTHAYLIVMGSVGRTGLPYLFMGSTAIKVARQLPCALLIVKRVQVLVPDAVQKTDDVNAAFAEGQELLADGFCQEAIARFDQCVAIDSRCADAVEAKAEALERLGNRQQAEECHKVAEMIRQDFWQQRVTASIRSEHPLFRQRGSAVHIKDTLR
jgi:nucleotide-binding universal stress UspA family protein